MSIPSMWRREALLFADGAILAAALLLSFQLRFEFDVPQHELSRSIVQLPLVVLLQLGALGLCGVYGFVSHYVGMAEIGAFLRAGALSFTALLGLRLGVPDELAAVRVPFSVAFLTTVLGIGGLLLARVGWRSWNERAERERHRLSATRGGVPVRTLLVGAGQAGLMAARELARQPRCCLELVGFVDDDPAKRGASVHGIRVLGNTGDLEQLIVRHRVEQLVITMVRVDKQVLRKLVARGEELGVKVRLMPGLHDILEGRVLVSALREVRIEDLLGRDPVAMDRGALLRLIEGRTVLVTGAGGSIGSELARQVVALRPERLLLVDRAEPALFAVQQELMRLAPGLAMDPMVADVADMARMSNVLRAHRPGVVLHAAAHKHVPLMELNPCEAVRNNSLATLSLGVLAGEARVDKFVLVSTDKAVRPSSVMGASKRLAELLVQDLNRRYATRYMAVRFGNVLGSTGSVIPIFREQIGRGGPVTVTDPNMVRYFMTIPEAAQLVLQAAAMGRGGEIFVLDMGEPVRILDLARQMIRLSGLEPGVDVEIEITGVRSGEKLHEELHYGDEEIDRTAHPRVFVGRPGPLPAHCVTAAVERITRLVEAGEAEALRACLGELLPEACLEPSTPGREGDPAVAESVA